MIARQSTLFILIGMLALGSTGCVTSLRPLEAERFAKLESEGSVFDARDGKNPWIAGGLGILAPLCNIYLAWGTGRTEQIPMAGVNLIAWPFSVAWAVPACALDTKAVNQLSFLAREVEPS